MRPRCGLPCSTRPRKIAEKGRRCYGADGPPEEAREGDLDPDFTRSLRPFLAGRRHFEPGTRSMFSTFVTWREVDNVISPARCRPLRNVVLTANRRGAPAAARAIREHHLWRTHHRGGPTRRRSPPRCLSTYRKSTRWRSARASLHSFELVARLEASSRPAESPAPRTETAARSRSRTPRAGRRARFAPRRTTTSTPTS
jgi:hypothetical protein